MDTTANAPALFDPERHQPVPDRPWNEAEARDAITRIATAAEAEFDAAKQGWKPHPLDDEDTPNACQAHLYSGAAGVIWALRQLAAQGAINLRTDFSATIAGLPQRAEVALAQERHGSASYLLGHSGALLLQWTATRQASTADALFEVVRSNLRNPVLEALWGS